MKLDWLEGGYGRRQFYEEIIEEVFEDKFFDYVFGNPDPQAFRIGWMTEGIPSLDFYVWRGLRDEEIEKIGHDERTLEIIARVKIEDPWRLAGLRAIKEAGVLHAFAVEDLEFTEEEEGLPSPARNIYFRIPYPCKYENIRKTFFKFALLLEKIGFRNNGQVVFNWMEKVMENEIAFAEYLSVSQIARMEKEEAERGERIDTTQAKQALERIFGNSPM